MDPELLIAKVKSELEFAMWVTQIQMPSSTSLVQVFAKTMLIEALRYELDRIEEGMQGGGTEEWLMEKWLIFIENNSGPHREADPDGDQPSKKPAQAETTRRMN